MSAGHVCPNRYCGQKITQHTTKHNTSISQYANIDYSMNIWPNAMKIKLDNDHVIGYGSYMELFFIKHFAWEVGASGDGMSLYSTFARYPSVKRRGRDE